MPIHAIHGEIEVEVTHECNWNCPYCAIHTHELPRITSRQLKEKIDGIPAFSNVTISGGEPGMLEEHDIDYILDTLEGRKCTIFLNTNGLFLRRYPSKISRFKQIVYHCSENLDGDDDIIKDIPCDTRYMIVVNDDNFRKLEAFLESHPDIRFDIVQATYNHFEDGVWLSKKNRNILATRFFSRMTKESFKRLFNEKKWEEMKFK